MNAVRMPLVSLVVGLALYSAPSTYAQGGIEVMPNSLDFGSVAVGSQESLVVTVENVGIAPVVLLRVALTPGSSGDFEITQGPSGVVFLPGVVEEPASASVEITVTFTPTGAGDASGSLTVEIADFSNSIVAVPLSGAGLIYGTPPDVQIQQILSFISTSVAAGTLEGAGPNVRSAKNRLRVLIRMLETASRLIAEGATEEAIDKLNTVYRKLDGAGRPSAFVTGSATGELATKINTLVADL